MGSFVKTFILTSLALIAFAANSVLCRLALGEGAIDPASFTVIRLVSGMVVLAFIVVLQTGFKSPEIAGSWLSSVALFSYAISFSFAYLSLNTGTGALILFGTVQISMILISIYFGARLRIGEWLGILIALAGFVYLVLPGVDAPEFGGFALMTLAGISWAIYTLRGRNSSNPLLETAFNFFRTSPLVILLLLVSIQYMDLNARGVMLAVLSGGLASGVGYTIWYAALKGLATTQAAVLQLSVPIIAAIGGVIIVSEPMTFRLLISTLIVMGGILLVTFGKGQVSDDYPRSN